MAKWLWNIAMKSTKADQIEEFIVRKSIAGKEMDLRGFQLKKRRAALGSGKGIARVWPRWHHSDESWLIEPKTFSKINRNFDFQKRYTLLSSDSSRSRKRSNFYLVNASLWSGISFPNNNIIPRSRLLKRQLSCQNK